MSDECLALLCRRIKFEDFTVEEMGELILSSNTGLYAAFLKKLAYAPDHEFIRNCRYIDRIKMAHKEISDMFWEKEQVLNMRRNVLELQEYERINRGPVK